MKKAGIKILQIILVLGLIYVCSLLLFFLKAGQDSTYIRAKGQAPLIIAHGGAKQLSPENTMIAFDCSDSIGVDMLEMDVMLTKDNILITHHNETIDRSTDGKGVIRDLTLEELQAYNFGYNFKDLSGAYSYKNQRVPVTTLEEVLKKYGKKYPMCIELKNKETATGQKAADELLRLLQKYEMCDKTIVSCFDDDIMKYFKNISNSKIRTATAKKETKKFVTLSLVLLSQFYTGNDDALQIPVENSGYRLDTESIIRAAHRKNMAVHYWTINDPVEMKRLIKLGADGLITDRPDLMQKVLEEMANELYQSHTPITAHQ